MSCTCGTAGCGGSPCATPRENNFTVESPQRFASSLAQLLIKPADRLRDLFTRFGMRPYVVHMLHTRWSGGARGIGEEYVVSDVPILPTPLIADLTTLQTIVSPVGTDESGTLLLSEISGCYSEEQLNGFLDGLQVPADMNFYFEIEFFRPDGAKTERRRFSTGTAANYDPGQFAWSIRLERARQDRRSNGNPR